MQRRYYRLRIRNSDDTDDEVIISSVPGDDNPFILEPPSGDGLSIDPLKGQITSGSYTIRVIDNGTTANAITANLADATARQQWLSRVAVVERSDDATTWSSLNFGYINAIRLNGGLVYEFAVGDTQRIEVSTEIFREVQPGLGYPTCIIGGPILMPLDETFATLRNFGGWGYKVDAVFTSPDYVRLKVVPGKIFDPRKANQGTQYQRLNVVSAALADANNMYVGPHFEASQTWASAGIQGWFPGVEIRLEETDGTFVGLFTPLTRPQARHWYDGVGHSELWIDNASGRDENGDPLGTWTPTVGHEYQLYQYIRTISTESPMHYVGHPVDLWEQIRIAANIPYDDTVLDAVKAQVGNDLKVELEITQSYKIADFDQQVIYGPFGLATRMVDGKRQLFSSRIKNSAVPSTTITINDLRTPGKPFDLDESTAIKRVELKQIRLTPWIDIKNKETNIWQTTAQSSTEQPTQPTIDAVIQTPLTQSIDNSDDDATVQSAGDLTYEIPGQIVIGGTYGGKYGALKREVGWLAGVADEIFDRWGRGIIACEIQCLPNVTELVGEEVVLDLMHMPVSVIGNSPVTARGGERVFQIVKRTETPSGPDLALLDAGTADEATDVLPEFTVSANADDPRKYVDVEITNGPDIVAIGGRIRVWVATGTSPASGSGVLARVIDPAVDDLTFTLSPFDAGTNVSVQMQTVITDQRPSALTAFDDVDLTDLDAPTGLAVTAQDAGDPSRRTLSWTVGANATDIPIEIMLRLTSESSSANRVVAILPAGSTQYELTGLDTANRTASVRHHEAAPFNGVSSFATIAVNTSGSARTLNPPISPRGFSNSDTGVYGMDVIATEFPSQVEFQVKVGAGSFATVAIVESELTGRTGFTDVATNDGLTRTMRARHISAGLTSSAWTSEVTVTSWNPESATESGKVWETSGPPDDEVGADGDWALDESVGIMYGPKSGGTWPAPYALVGIPAGGSTGDVLTKDSGTDFDASFQAPATGSGDPSSSTHAATSKTTPVDADEIPLLDSAASFALKKLTWANLKATAKTYFDTVYAALAHHTQHESGGSDAIKLDDLATPDDNTDLNVSTSHHGLTPKAPNDATKYLDGTGAYSSPAAVTGAVSTTGTFTPGVAFGGGTTGLTYTSQIGRYERIGNSVGARLYIQINNKGSSTGNMTVTGLPFATKNTSGFLQAAAVGLVSGINGAITAWAVENTTILKLFLHSTGAFVTNANAINGGEIIINFVYECEP